MLLATLATIIASQSIITGAFSMTRQAIQLGWLPRVRIRQTSESGYGQIYVGVVNWLLMLITVGLTLGFGKSDNLAAAYGIAVSLTMLMTSALLYMAMQEVWGWSAWASGAAAGALLCVDAPSSAPTSSRSPREATCRCCWPRWSTPSCGSGIGARRRGRGRRRDADPVAEFLAELKAHHVPRVPGTAVFITRTTRDTPPVMRWHVQKNRALHAKLLVLKYHGAIGAVGRGEQRLALRDSHPDFWRVTARYGFMERPDIPRLLQRHPGARLSLQLDDVTYYVGHETIVPAEDGPGLCASRRSCTRHVAECHACRRFPAPAER